MSPGLEERGGVPDFGGSFESSPCVNFRFKKKSFLCICRNYLYYSGTYV